MWVSFDLGRPLGVPNNPEFQTSVLKHALNLFEAPAGPVLEDFPEDAPDTKDEPVHIACPVNFRSKPVETTSIQQMLDDFSSEVMQMRTWYNLACEKKKRTTTGVSGLFPEEAAEFLSAFVKGEPPETKVIDTSIADSIRMAAEDLKAYYFEAVSAQPGQPTDSTSLANWFWGDTVAALVINRIRKMCLEDGDNKLELLGKLLLVPRSQMYRFKDL
ncbi:hypothetical protein ACFL2E_05155 [Thermodesulfobacteriota bacterium]